MNHISKLKQQRDKHKIKYEALNNEVENKIKEAEQKLIAEIGMAFYLSLRDGSIDKQYVAGLLKSKGKSKTDYLSLIDDVLSASDVSNIRAAVADPVDESNLSE